MLRNLTCLALLLSTQAFAEVIKVPLVPIYREDGMPAQVQDFLSLSEESAANDSHKLEGKLNNNLIKLMAAKSFNHQEKTKQFHVYDLLKKIDKIIRILSCSL
jgi:hypothetical protein